MRILDQYELAKVLDSITEYITEKVTRANRLGELDQLLLKLEMPELIKEEEYIPHKYGKLLIIGDTRMPLNIAEELLKEYGVKNPLEYVDFDAAKMYPYDKLRYNPNYKIVFFGPVHHKTRGTGHFNSAITRMEHTEGFPKVIRLGGNNLKITKSNFQTALHNLISTNEIIAE